MRLNAKDRNGYGSDVRATALLVGPFNVLYTAIIILVDLGVLTPGPWYTLATAAIILAITLFLLRL